MEQQDIKRIEQAIQYTFKNKKLLEEALVVEPVADQLEYSSEVFRIPGKRAINYALTKFVLEKFAETSESGYHLLQSKDDVNALIDALYSPQVYTMQMQIMGLVDFLSIPSDDFYHDMARRLFESLVGAVTIDSNWNMEIITDVVRFLLDADFYFEHGFDHPELHYVATIYNWCVDNDKSFPVYRFAQENGEQACSIKFGPSVIIGRGASKTVAKFDAARQVYLKLVLGGYIQERDEDGYLVGDPGMLPSEAIEYLTHAKENEEIGEFTLSSVDAEDGIIGVCDVEGEDFQAQAYGKTIDEAKQQAALLMVKYLLGYRIETYTQEEVEEEEEEETTPLEEIYGKVKNITNYDALVSQSFSEDDFLNETDDPEAVEDVLQEVSKEYYRF